MVKVLRYREIMRVEISKKKKKKKKKKKRKMLGQQKIPIFCVFNS